MKAEVGKASDIFIAIIANHRVLQARAKCFVLQCIRVHYISLQKTCCVTVLLSCMCKVIQYVVLTMHILKIPLGFFKQSSVLS